MEKHKFDHEEVNIQDISASKNNSKTDMEEILRRRRPEFEHTPESITELQKPTDQGTGQTIISPDPTTDPTGKTSDDTVKQQKDTELEQQIEKLKLDEESWKNQKIAELREQITEIQQTKKQENQQPNSEATQDDEYYHSYGH